MLLRAFLLPSVLQQSRRHQDRGHSLGSDALAAAGETEFLRCRGLDRNSSGVNVQHSRQPRCHRGCVRCDLRAFADQGYIGIRQYSSAGGNTLSRVGEEKRAVSVPPRRLRWWKMAPDVTLRQRSIDGVTERMDADIRIGVTGQAL